jgi:hypothetical protein
MGLQGEPFILWIVGSAAICCDLFVRGVALVGWWAVLPSRVCYERFHHQIQLWTGRRVLKESFCSTAPTACIITHGNTAVGHET